MQQANVATAEPPLADWSHVATSAAAEPPLPGEEIKHRFVLVDTHEQWLHRFLHIDVDLIHTSTYTYTHVCLGVLPLAPGPGLRRAGGLLGGEALEQLLGIV